jgi:hypothetical protein
MPAAAEPPRGEFEVHELSLWIADGAAPVANARASFASAFPATVTSSRPRAAAALTPGPVGLITFHGRPAGELDVELRVKNGSFLGHWPPGEIAGNRLLWPRKAGFALVEQPENESTLTWVDQDHWFQKARKSDALFIRSAARAERFLAYDAERKLTSPVRLQGGPDKFTIINDSDSTLYDVILVRSTPAGVRVAWLDELPKTDVKQAPAAKASEAAAPAPDQSKPAADKSKPAAGLFGLAKPAGSADEPKAKAAPEKDGAAENKEAAQSQPEGKAEADKPSQDKPPVGLFGLPLPKAAAAATKDNPAPLAGGVELVLSDPLAASSEDAKERTVGELARRLGRTGLTAGEVDVFLGQYASQFFEQEGMIVACRLEPSTQDAELPLSIFPVPEKVVRAPLLVVRNVDPQLPQQIDQLIAELGAGNFAQREKAEKQLTQFGSRAFEPLQKAINDKDLEIVIRAERILLNQGQKAAGRQGTTGATAPAPDKLAKPGEVAPAK